MERIDTRFLGVCILKPQMIGNAREYFIETYNQKEFAQIGITSEFVQENLSYSAHKGTIRGIHFQNAPYAQAKIIRVLQGAVLDITVDLRKGSPTYKQWIGVELSEKNKWMLFIPRGFGHGFKTLTDDVKFCYQVDNPYSEAHDRCIRFNDPDIGIEWGMFEEERLSIKDRNASLLSESDCNFVYGEI